VRLKLTTSASLYFYKYGALTDCAIGGGALRKFFKNALFNQTFRNKPAASLSLLNLYPFLPLPGRGEEEGKGRALIKTYKNTLDMETFSDTSLTDVCESAKLLQYFCFTMTMAY